MAVVLALSVVALAPGVARAADWVGLGDSYAAGPLIPNQSLSPLGCLRSSRNFAHIAATNRGMSLVVNYAAILPETGSGCWPQVPLAYADVPYLRGKQKALNAMLQTAAADNAATYVDDYSASIGKDACRSAGTRWVEPLVPGNAAETFHPTPAAWRASRCRSRRPPTRRSSRADCVSLAVAGGSLRGFS